MGQSDTDRALQHARRILEIANSPDDDKPGLALGECTTWINVLLRTDALKSSPELSEVLSCGRSEPTGAVDVLLLVEDWLRITQGRKPADSAAWCFEMPRIYKPLARWLAETLIEDLNETLIEDLNEADSDRVPLYLLARKLHVETQTLNRWLPRLGIERTATGSSNRTFSLPEARKIVEYAATNAHKRRTKDAAGELLLNWDEAINAAEDPIAVLFLKIGKVESKSNQSR